MTVEDATRAGNRPDVTSGATPFDARANAGRHENEHVDPLANTFSRTCAPGATRFRATSPARGLVPGRASFAGGPFCCRSRFLLLD
jgi:hypothetical protein